MLMNNLLLTRRVAFAALWLALHSSLLPAQNWPDTPQPSQPLGSEIWVDAPIVTSSPCEDLADRVCGKNRACADQPACRDVQRLLDQEKGERAAAENPKRMTPASGKCQEADRNRRRYVTCGK